MSELVDLVVTAQLFEAIREGPRILETEMTEVDQAIGWFGLVSVRREARHYNAAGGDNRKREGDNT